MRVVEEVSDLPIIRPLACFDKSEIIDLAKEIGTYETSILPFEDCCTIFVPEHPVINPTLKKCLEYEALIDYESMIKECLEKKEVISQNIRQFDDIL
jgi:thiamine biosynthesis protein ThiI